jgi:hypothetical protein
MIEIHFNHKIEHKVLSRDILSIGHGLPQHGQLDFVTLITEYVALADGQVLTAVFRWGFGWWRVLNYWNKLRRNNEKI